MLPKLLYVAGSFCALSMYLAVPSAGAGCLRGHIADGSGGAVAGATVMARQADSGSSRLALTGRNGEFEICGLEPGRYEVTAKHEGFGGQVRSATVAGDADLSLDMRLAKADVPGPDGSKNPSGTDVDAGGSGTAGVNEFRYAVKSAAPETIPDSPSAGRARRDLAHGEAYGFWGSGLVGQPNVNLLGQFPLSQFGGSVGGELGGGRTAYFVAFDQFGMDSQKLLAAVAAAQARSSKPALPANANVVSLTSLEARVDHRFSQGDSAYARLRAGDASSSLAVRGPDGSPKLADTRRLRQISATTANTADLSPNTVNETSAQYVSNEMQLPPRAVAGSIQSGLSTAHRDRVFEAADNVYRQVGGQSLRFGGDFIFNQRSISFLESAMGRSAAGESSLSQSSRSTGLFIQSQRQVRPNVLLTSGVRYEIQPIKGFKTDMNNLAPQVGFAWSPSSRTVIRGGGAMYYDQIPLPAIPASANGSDPADLASSARFTSPSGSPAAQMTLFTVFDPVMQNSYIETANFGIEQKLSAHTVVASDYQFARGVQLAVPVFRTALLCTSPAACRAGNTLHVREMGTGAESSFKGITVSFTQEPVRWGSYRVAYTRSSAEGSGTEGNASYISDDLRRVSFTGVLHTSADVASNWRERLSRGYVLSGTGDYSSRSEFAGMNFINMNARLTKTLAWGQHYRLDALAETFNSFERTNAAFAKSFENMNDRAANVFSTYRAIASLQGPTSTQFGFRLGF
jgi:hypothetical protein